VLAKNSYDELGEVYFMNLIQNMNSPTPPTPPSEFLTVGQVAAALAVPVGQVREWAEAGAFARFYINGDLLFHQQDIIDFLFTTLFFKLETAKFRC
jgi:hypothetical protein